MKHNLSKSKPPNRYISNFMEYRPGLDTNPDLLDFLINGFTLEEAEKMRFLLSIESAKHHLREAQKYGELTETEVRLWEAQIESMIENYNAQSSVT